MQREALATICATDNTRKKITSGSHPGSPPSNCCITCHGSKEHTELVPGQSKSPSILQWVTKCVSWASHFRGNIREKENNMRSFSLT